MKNNYEHTDVNYEINNKGLSVHKRELTSNYPLHFHDSFEIEYILSGKGKTKINNTNFELSAGSLIFITPTDFQYIEVEETVELININFSSDWIDDSVTHRLQSATVLQNIDGSDIFRIYDEFNKSSLFCDLSIKGLLNCLAVNIIRQMAPQTGDAFTDITRRLAHHIRLHHSESIDLNTLSKVFGYTPNYLSFVFSKAYNFTIKQYIIKIRLEHAVKMLISTDASVTAICYDCGFKSFSNFLRTFKTKYGMTPKEYRKKYKM